MLTVPALAGCGSEDPAGKPLAGADVADADRSDIADGGTLRWAVDTVPDTLNTFQADADTTTARIAEAVLPSMYRTDGRGRAVRNPDYLASAEVVDTEPKQVVVYKLAQQAVWSDGREIGAADFAAQWRALSGKDTAYWTARNAGYDRIEKVERGKNDLEIKVTFDRPYADWKSLFSPLYPKEVMGSPDSFNDGARKKLKVTAGPFTVDKVDTEEDEVVLARNPRWWGSPAKLQKIVLRAVPHDKRVSALSDGTLDLAEIDPEAARRITAAALPQDGNTPLMGPEADRSAADALRSWAVANGSDEDAADEEISARRKLRKKAEKYARQQKALGGFEVRRSLEPAYTQLALNGAEGPLSDERVRRAVARALDREEIAKAVLKPLGLPAEPVGSHLALSGQAAYADSSGALGTPDAKEARALLSDARLGTGRSGEGGEEGREEGRGRGGGRLRGGHGGRGRLGRLRGLRRKRRRRRGRGRRRHVHRRRGRRQGPAGLRHRHRPAEEGRRPRRRLRPAGHRGPGPRRHRTGRQGRQGAGAAVRAAVRARFEDAGDRGRPDRDDAGEDRHPHRHLQGRQRQLLQGPHRVRRLRPGPLLLAGDRLPRHRRPPGLPKPVPAADGSLNVEQNWTRVGTDQVDQLFDQAVATLDDSERRDLIRKADSRIWAAAGSIPLYQRPQLVAARETLANAGAFGFATPSTRTWAS